MDWKKTWQVLLLITAPVVYIWTHVGSLAYYTPQLVALIVLVFAFFRGSLYFLREKRYQLVTEPEIVFLHLLCVLLIVSTGVLDSFFLPLTYLNVFFLIIFFPPTIAIATGLEIVAVYFALSNGLSLQNVSVLMSIPLLMSVFLFTKKQIEERARQVLISEQAAAQLASVQTNALFFISTFLKPKMMTLMKLSSYPEANKLSIQQQISIIQREIDQLMADQNQP